LLLFLSFLLSIAIYRLQVTTFLMLACYLANNSSYLQHVVLSRQKDDGSFDPGLLKGSNMKKFSETRQGSEDMHALSFCFCPFVANQCHSLACSVLFDQPHSRVIARRQKILKLCRKIICAVYKTKKYIYMIIICNFTFAFSI
jgi:hypothetical protein